MKNSKRGSESAVADMSGAMMSGMTDDAKRQRPSPGFSAHANESFPSEEFELMKTLENQLKATGMLQPDLQVSFGFCHQCLSVLSFNLALVLESFGAFAAEVAAVCSKSEAASCSFRCRDRHFVSSARRQLLVANFQCNIPESSLEPRFFGCS